MASAALRRRFRRVDQLDAAGLAAAARMNLRLHDPLRAADLACRLGGLAAGGGHVAGGHRDAVTREQLLGLVFVQIHSE